MSKLHIDHVDIIMGMVFIIGLGMLLTCSFFVIKPFLVEKGLKPANCTLEDLRYHKGHVTGILHICLIITVSYTTATNDGGVLIVSNATLYDFADNLHRQCPVTNRDYLADSWRDGHVWPCWFNPQNTSQVIAGQAQSYWGTIHSALWPSIAVLGSASFFIARKCTPRLEE